jgi:hypothetical protein
LKSKIAIAALIFAALICTSANAATVLLSFSGSGTTFSASAIYGGNSYSINADAVICSGAGGPCNTPYPSAYLTSHGLGISGPDEISDDDYIVLDFSGIKNTLNGLGASGVSFTLYETGSGTSSVANIYALAGTTNPLGDSTNTIGGLSNTGSVQNISLSGAVGTILGPYTVGTAIDSYYVVDVTGSGCSVVIASGAVPAVPEPATFVLAGTALIGLAFAMKRRQQKS